MTAACTHRSAMRQALANNGECPACAQEDKLEQAKQEVARVQAEEQDLIREEIEGPKPKREKHGEVVEIHADCCECEWDADSKNAMGLAAQHHDRTGHTVIVEQTQKVTFGDPEKANQGGNPEDVF